MFMILFKMCIKFSFSKESLTIVELVLLLLHHAPTRVSKKHGVQITQEEMALVCLWSFLPLPMPLQGMSYPFSLSSGALLAVNLEIAQSLTISHDLN